MAENIGVAWAVLWRTFRGLVWWFAACTMMQIVVEKLGR